MTLYVGPGHPIGLRRLAEPGTEELRKDCDENMVTTTTTRTPTAIDDVRSQGNDSDLLRLKLFAVLGCVLFSSALLSVRLGA